MLVSALYLAISGASFGGGKIDISSPRKLYLHEEGIIGDSATSADAAGGNANASNKSVAQDNDEEFLVQLVTEKLQKRDLGLKPHQFAHLHHMKTGGTSFNSLLRCGLDRARSIRSADIPFYSLSECGWSHFYRCYGGEDPSCTQNTQDAYVMEFCAPFFAVSHFNWTGADLVTVLRNPVDRVWSMYRFQTMSCYKCLPLKEIYNRIDNGTTEAICGECQSVCMMQLTNHLTRNLVTGDPAKHRLSDEEMLAEAKANLHKYIAFVGVTDEIVAFSKMIGKVFPWLNETVEGSDIKCSLPHANASPSNNGCGENRGHLPLPDEPDEETREIIFKHNKLDMELYNEAKKIFSIQKEVLGFV